MWNELVTSALIGTERRVFTLDDLPDELRELAAQLEGQDSERVLLTLAGTLALYRRAGQAPQIDNSPLPDPCPPDAQPFCSVRAGQMLQQILMMPNHSQYLQEWIALAHSAHQRIPPEYLPRFLTAFEKNSNLPDHFYDVIGVRGQWLAWQNPVWAYAVLPENDTEWELANINARVHVLRQLRASDPAHARALVEAVWSSEKAETRAALLSAYDVGLNLDDETLLEKALDDRAAIVRDAAARLIAKLPGSAYQGRMIARAQPLLQIVRKRKKLNIVVNLPTSYDGALLRDGIATEPPKGSNFSEALFALIGIVSRLPASYWLSGNWSARELVEAADTNHNWRGILLDCLAEIAGREDRHNVADALLETEIQAETLVSTLRAASSAARDAYGLRALERQLDDQIFDQLGVLDVVGHAWSVNLTRGFLARARKNTEASAGSGLAYARYITNFAMNMSPTCVDDLRALQPEDRQNNPIWARAVKQAVSTLEFRQKMFKEFSR